MNIFDEIKTVEQSTNPPFDYIYTVYYAPRISRDDAGRFTRSNKSSSVVKCLYCGGGAKAELLKCPNCGAPLPCVGTR